MKEHPIIFRGPMVRAILAGRKTQTRRVVRNPGLPCATDEQQRDEIMRNGRRHYGHPGDRLWVRENCRASELSDDMIDGVTYAADEAFISIENTKEAGDQWLELYSYRRKRGAPIPSIHMPRWASRINLTITSTRIERLHSISSQDAIAEGLHCLSKDGGQTYKYGVPERDWLPGPDGWPWQKWSTDPVKAFQVLWTDINGPESWAKNPWVWVIQFRRCEA